MEKTKRTKIHKPKAYALRVDAETEKVLEAIRAEGGDLASILREMVQDARPGLEMIHAAMVSTRTGRQMDVEKWIGKVALQVMSKNKK